MGSPQTPTVEQYARLKEAGQLGATEFAGVVDVSDGKVTISDETPAASDLADAFDLVTIPNAIDSHSPAEAIWQPRVRLPDNRQGGHFMSQEVAILGLGTMGAGIAANLMKAGFSLIVYNRTASKAQDLVSQGARLAATPADAARGASIILGMLADDAASRAVWTDDNGALEGVEKGAILIESSTVSPAWIAELAALAAQRGAELIDAPVAGSRMQAAAGQLWYSRVEASKHSKSPRPC